MKPRMFFKKALSVLLCLVLVLSYLPASAMDAAGASQALDIVRNSKKADYDTTDRWEDYFGTGKMDTEFAGAVWTDKSVFKDEDTALPGVTLDGDNNFLVALSAIASNLSITGHTSTPTDTMLVLDMSGSMVDGTYEVGTIRQGYNYQTVDGIDMSLINAMIDATNSTIDKLMKQNTNNRVGVVLYSGNSNIEEDATPSTATVVLPLGRYAGVNGKYLSVDTTWTTSTLYTRRGDWFNSSWQASGEATYVLSGTAVNVSVENGLKTEAGGDVRDLSKQANGGTYIQNGLYQAMNQFLSVTDTTVPEGKPQAGAERMPALVLMTDGAPTIATTSYNNIGDSNEGDGRSTTDRITFLTQLTAAYVRGRVAAKYQENTSDEKDMLFLTLGLGTENSSAATETLYPAGSNTTLVGYWNRYLAGAAGSNVQVNTGNNGWRVYRDSAVEAMNYVDKYFYASDAQGLLNSFEEIVSEISLKAESYATLVESSGADFSGYVTFEDELGALMHVADVKGVLMSDGKGGKVLYTGKGVAEFIVSGGLGTVDRPTERGDELVRTVKERIPGLTTTQAQQLIDYAYNDQQLYHTDNNNWSNYIGWYADAEGNYAGFWDKDSGYENAPANAVYANKSYGYLGVQEDTDMMHVVVLVRTDLTTLDQTVLFKIPASLLPTVQYHVTLDEDDPSRVEEFEREDAIPMQLVFEAGLRPDINSVNLKQKIDEYIQKGGKFPADAIDETSGAVTLYTNEWAIGNDTNGNGIPDPEEVDTAVVAQSHFHPALDNNRFYYTEDTVILTGNDSKVTGSTRPTDTDGNAENGTGYYYNRYIYSTNGRQVIKTPIAATTLANDALYDTVNGEWYIPAGTMYHDLARFRTEKEENVTDTLDYSFFPAVFDSVSKQDVYTFLGNNGSIAVAPATGFTLNKQVDGTIEGVSSYTFQVTLSDIPAGAAVNPVLTNANGDALTGVTMSPMTDNKFTVTMPAGVTAYVSGIPAGTAVQIAELINGDYQVTKILVADAEQTGSATLTVPGYTAGGTQMVPVEFTNAPNYYGNLVISKDILHELASDPAAMAEKEFTFHITLSGSRIAAGDTFATSKNGDKAVVNEDMSLTWENGQSIKLKDDESVTIYGLPVGTAYTITEDNLPGFKLDNIGGDNSITQATGTIPANGESLADFYNRYPDDFVPVEIPVSLDVTKALTELSPYDGNEQFKFVLQMLLPDESYPSIEGNNGEDYVSIGANDTVHGAYTLTFDKIGTYFFRVVELEPAAGEKTPGMTYSTMRALFRVEVTDVDMDGTLEIAVLEEANIDEIAAQYTDGDSEKISGITVKVTFTNTYEVGSTNTTLHVHKTLNDLASAQKPLTDFRFTMYPCDASGVVAEGAQGTVVTSSALGDATFNILLEQADTYYYKVIENIPDDAVLNPETGKYERNGMTYDATEYLFTVVAEVNGEGEAAVLEITQRTLLNLTTNETVDPDDKGNYVAQFLNEYKLTSTQVDIPLSKTLTGRASNGEAFKVLITPTDATFNQLPGSTAEEITLYHGVAGVKTLTFQKVGTYHYKITEIIPEGATLNTATGRYELNGVSYDPAQYHVTITASDNGQGGLAAQTVIHKLGEIAPVTTAAFVNTYTVTGSDDVTISGLKVITGENGNPSDRILAAGEFAIGLYSDEACQQLIETVTNKADGTFAFSAIHYTAEHLGENNAEKTYTYYVKEVPGSKGGMTYDPVAYPVTVKVSHENGKLVVTPSENAVELKITNIYKADPVVVTLNGEKTLSGDWSAVADKGFTFELYKTGADFVIAEGQSYVQRASVTGAQSFTMSLTYADGEEGFYYYVLKENTSTQAGGVGYDAGEYHITVNVTDPGNGTLNALVTMYRPGTGNTQTALFNNLYTVEPITITLEGDKSFINTTNDEAIDMEDDEFTFVILEVEDPADDLAEANLVTIGYSKADGTIDFPEIRYTAAGVHYYKIVELGDSNSIITYDDTVFDVTVTVTDNGNGTLTAEADYNGKAVSFENTYTPGPAQVDISGIKTLSGDWSNVPNANKFFSFALYKADSNFDFDAATDLEEQIDQVTEGIFSFESLVYEAAGTWYYVVKELGSTDDNGIAYSEAEIRITVKVEDDGEGHLIPTVTSDFADAVITYDENNVSVATVSELKFINTYSVDPVPHSPVAQKIYEGDDMKTFDFELVNEDGIFETQVKQNNDDGEIFFDELLFEEAGTYTFKVTEKENILWGFIKWDTNVYTLTIEVVDNGYGKLVLDDIKTVSRYGRDDLVFRNVHEDLITQKDVFLASAPNISIDGQKVQVGDVLTYTITYTNYAGTKVDAVITDVIPEYTTYVADSASEGGTLNGNTLTWSFTQVEPDEVITVSFQVQVADAGVTILNKGKVLEGNNEYETNEVENPVDEIVKDVFLAEAPESSIDGKKVKTGDILTYKITYTNADDEAAQVTITDKIPANTIYVEGSADNGGTLAGGILTWNLDLDAGESKTVSFQVEVTGSDVIIENYATGFDGINEFDSNKVTNPVDEIVKDVFLGTASSSIDGKKVQVGDILTYKITYTNADDEAAQVTITDKIPANTAYVKNSADNGGTLAGGILTWNLDLDAGESKTVSFQVEVIGSNVIIENYATGFDGINEFDSNKVTNPVDEIVKDVFLGTASSSIDGKKVQVGDILTYKITYTNADNQAAQVTITDKIPANTVYVKNSADNGGTLAGGILTWNLDLDEGESKTVSFQVEVIGSNVIIENYATGFDGINEFDSNKVTNPVDEIVKDVFHVAEPEISIDGKKVKTGDILLYKITYTNADDEAAQVTVTDKIPANTIYVEGSADNGGTLAGGILTWNLELDAGESKTVSFQVEVIGSNVIIENYATGFDGINEFDSNMVENPVDEIVKDVFLAEAPTVSIDGKEVEKNDILLYKITYTNAYDDAAQVTITDTIPEHTTYVEDSADNGGIFADGKLTWTLELDAGESKTVSFRVKVVATKITVVNQAFGESDGNTYETNIVRNPVDEDIVVKNVYADPAFTTKIDGKKVEKGDVLYYTITYTNADGIPGTVTITDTIPEHTAYVEGSADNGGIFADGKLTWTLELAADQSKTVSFSVKVTEANAVVTNQASAQEGENKLETNKVDNPVVEDKVIKDVFHTEDPAVSIDGKKVENGSILLYKVTYTNNDDFAAKVTITDTIPEHTAYVEGSADNGGIFADGKLTWTLELAAGQSKTVSFQVKVTASGITVINQAAAQEGDNKLETNKVANPVVDDKAVKDVFQADAPTVSIDGKKVEKDDVLLYTITYTNADDVAAEVIITDAIPEHTSYVGGSADNGAAYVGGKLTWVLELAPGESKTVSFRVKVTGEGVTINNQAIAQEGENELKTNTVTNTVPAPSVTPETGDSMNLILWTMMLLLSAAGIFVLMFSKKRFA